MPDKYTNPDLQQGGDYLDFFRPGTHRPVNDPRDYTTSEHPLPKVISLPNMFVIPSRPTMNQGQRGSCAAFGVGRSLTRGIYTQTKDFLDISEEVLYAEGRAQINLLCNDGGSDPRTNAAICCEKGLPSESVVPYMSHDLCWRPGAPIWQQQIAKGEKYVSLQTREDVKQALVAGFEPTVCLQLYKNFVPDAGGFIPLPQGSVWGGHCMTFVGYDFRGPKNYWVVKNQWGDSWGISGSCYLPDEFWDLPENSGGIWKTTGIWVIYPAVAPKPEPVKKQYFFEFWDRGGTEPTGHVDVPAELIEGHLRVVAGLKSVENGNQTMMTGWIDIDQRQPKLTPGG